MFHWLRKIHTYIGLLSWSIVLVFGIAGLDAVVSSTFELARGTKRSTTVDFVVLPNLTDTQVVEAVWRKLQIPLTAPGTSYDLHRDGSNNLCFNFWTVAKGEVKVSVLEPQKQVLVEEDGPNLWAYLNSMHTVTVAERTSDWRMRYWSYYTEFGIWMLLAMTITGVWQWLASRPGLRWAQISFVLACVSFVVLYVFMR